MLVGLCAAAAPRDTKSQYVEISSDTSFVTCFKEPVGSRLARGPVLISPDGRFRAYTEVEARAVKAGDEVQCVNRSRLYVGVESQPYENVFMEEPRIYMQGNTLTLVDWSADSRYLLMQLFDFQYASDAASPRMLLYDTRNQYFLSPLVDDTFGRLFNKTCNVRADPLGFSPQGTIVLKAANWVEVDGESSAPCLPDGKESRWEFDLTTGTVNPMDSTVRPRHYGRTQKSSSNSNRALRK
jgi:hypothetical protein